MRVQVGKRHEGLQKLVDALPAIRHKVNSTHVHMCTHIVPDGQMSCGGGFENGQSH